MNNLNCHPERVEGSQLLHISSRDIAENAKLNHEIAKELKKQSSMSCQCPTLASRSNKDSLATWILRSSRSMTRMYVLLSIITLLPTLAQAETCTPTPDCKSLGYTETSCPDGGGVKCPWNTSLMYCPQCKQKDLCQSCNVGWILNSDMTCSQNKVSGKTPIGVVANQTITSVGAAVKCVGMAVALNDISSSMNWTNGNSQCNSYSASGVTGWHMPTKEELLTIHSNISSVQDGLTKAGGTQFNSSYYWSSSRGNTYSAANKNYWIVNPVSGGSTTYTTPNSYYVRPVLDLSGLI